MWGALVMDAENVRVSNKTKKQSLNNNLNNVYL